MGKSKAIILQEGQKELTRQLEELKKLNDSSPADASLYVENVNQMIASVKVGCDIEIPNRQLANKFVSKALNFIQYHKFLTTIK